MPGVLLVDADPAVRDMLTTVFTRGGFAVRTAGQSDEAVRLARAERPDVVVTGLDLRPVDGVDMLHQLRALPGCAAVPAVVYTAATQHDALARMGGVPLPRVAIETKGGSPRVVVAAARRLLDEA